MSRVLSYIHAGLYSCRLYSKGLGGGGGGARGVGEGGGRHGYKKALK